MSDYKNKNYDNKMKYQDKKNKKADIRKARLNSHKYSNYSEEEIYMNGLKDDCINNNLNNSSSKEILDIKKNNVKDDMEKEIEENKKNIEIDEEEYEEFSPDYFEPQVYVKK